MGTHLNNFLANVVMFIGWDAHYVLWNNNYYWQFVSENHLLKTYLPFQL